MTFTGEPAPTEERTLAVVVLQRSDALFAMRGTPTVGGKWRSDEQKSPRNTGKSTRFGLP
ncbi:hypothetical protein OG239_00850 [Streptomyces sp. NBC_00868]|uniref:hypothetical protein n=1 Tax=Streptomyces sp. NBC_00868 TaxID=2903683 RepID=UPI0038667EAF|nr:hypothetical protein OG239_00850 [Streptomyces sp. NBC_00868]